jgi:hypothetical protein
MEGTHVELVALSLLTFVREEVTLSPPQDSYLMSEETKNEESAIGSKELNSETVREGGCVLKVAVTYLEPNISLFRSTATPQVGRLHSSLIRSGN